MRTFFISSTFRDMQKERDEMHRRLVPELSKVAFENGDTIAIRDLRWGVNTDEMSEEEANRKVLDVCLNEIDECRPYMIILLGDRYGFCPGGKLIEDTVRKRNELVQAKANEKFELEDNDISITEMEIQYGVSRKLCGDKFPKILAYVREIVPQEGNIPKEFLQEDEEHWNRQKKLIEKVKKWATEYPDDIKWKDYQMTWDSDEKKLCGAEEFIREKVIRDVKELLEKEWKKERSEKLSPLDRELNKHDEYANVRRKNYFVRKKIVEDICKRRDDGINLLVLRGESGCGKTALMSYLSGNMKDNPYVLLLFCGYTSSVCRAQDIEKIIVEYLEKILKIENDSSSENNHKALHDRMEELIELFQKTGAHDGKRRLLIMLDAIDQLDADEMRDHLTFLPGNLSGDVQVILSCTPQFELLFMDEKNVLDIGPLSEENGSLEKTEILQEMFRSHGKEWDDNVLEAIEEKHSSDNPLYLSLVVQRLAMMDENDFRIIDKDGNHNHGNRMHQMEIVSECPDDTSEMCAYILNSATEMIAKSASKSSSVLGVFQRVIRYIAISRFGLRDMDLEQLINSGSNGTERWNTLDFTRFFWYMRQLFIIRDDGRYDFSHVGIRKSYREYFQNQQEGCTDEKKMHKQILSHLKNLDEKDPVRVNEYVYHCRQADYKAAFVEYICGYRKTGASDVYTVAANEVRRMCMEDVRDRKDNEKEADYLNEIWLYQVLNLCNPWLNVSKTPPVQCNHIFEAHETEGLLYFISECLTSAFGESDEELSILRCLLEKGCQLAKELHDKKRDEESKYLVVDFCRRLGDVCQRQGGLLNYNTSLRWYGEARDWDNKDSSHGREEDDLIHQVHQGDIYAAMAGRENRNRALGLYKGALEMVKNVQEKNSLQRKIANLLMEGSWESQKEGFSLLKSLKEQGGADVSQIPDLLRYGDAVLRLYGSQEEKALNAFRKAEEMAGKKRREMPDEKNMYIWILTRERVLFAKGLQHISADQEKYEKLIEDYREIYSSLDALEKKEKSLKLKRARAVCLEHEGYLLLRFARMWEDNVPESIFETARDRLKRAKDFFEEDCWKERAIDVRRDLMVLNSNLGDLSALEEINGKKSCLETPSLYYEEAYKIAVQLKKELDTPSACADAITVRLRMGELMVSCRNGDEQRNCYLRCLEAALSLTFETGAPSDMLIVSDIYHRLADLEQTGISVPCIRNGDLYSRSPLWGI